MGFKTVPYSTTVCGTRSEDTGVLTLTAPNNATYSTTFTAVNFASYGTPNGGCGNFSFGGCHAGSSYGVVYNAFIGRTSGSVNPTNGVFGDPCLGTYKRLYIQLTASGTQQVFVPLPTITQFYGNPNPQNSTSGIPQYGTSLTWVSTGGLTATITSSTGESFSVNPSGTLNITNLPQSNTTNNSPSTRNYTLTVYNELNEPTSSTITIQSRNDNTPSNFWTQTFSNLEPNTEYQFFIGKLSGVDMPTLISTSGSNNFVGKTVGGTFAQSLLFDSEENVILKFTSLPFNTDVSGVTGIYGKTNVKTISVTAGTQSFNVTAATRPPRIAEDFNYADNKSEYPFQDVDLIANAPNQYATSNSITVDDVELLSSDNAIEIKSNSGDLQVNINNTGWKNVRQI